MKNVSKLSLIAFIDSISSLVFFGLAFAAAYDGLRAMYLICWFIWFISGIASPFIPLAAKKYRINNNIDKHVNKPLEIAALVLSLFTIYAIASLVFMLSASTTIASAILAVCMAAYWGMKETSCNGKDHDTPLD